MEHTAAYQRRWQILAVLSLSLVLIGLDTLVIQLALPSVQRELDTTATQLQWVVDAYTLTFGGLLLFAGGLSDRFGRKRVLTIGLLSFLVFTLGAAFAPSGEALVALRAAMGVSAALIMPATLAIIKDVFPAQEQGKAIGIWSGAAAIGVPLGPAVSGLLLDHYWWGSIFLINVPVVAIAVIVGLFLIPESRNPSHPGLDLLGAALSVTGLVAIVYGIVEAPRHGWDSPATLGALGAGVVLLALFVWWERRTSKPMLSVGLFRNVRYGGGALTITLVAFGLFSALFLLTQYLQFVLALDPMQAGIRMLAVGTMMLGAPLSPVLVERIGLKLTAAAGMLLCTVAAVMLAGLTVDAQAQALWGLAVLGLGVGIALPAGTDAVMVSAPAHQAGAGSAVADAAMQIGGTLGIAITGSVATTLYRDDLGTVPGADIARDSIGAAAAAAAQLGGDGARALLDAANRAFAASLDAAYISAGVAIAGALIALLILPRHRQEPAPAEASPQPEPEPAEL
ncbi:MFS transporter [Actinoplanes sp. RD1]|uniref:MFS transporter n=1 Tax=Actinoplanes sp. RD1 TaxID=3064538 RepID=UPI002742477F|nr:MFS transporter [Actinoplanes sp. RD1]